MGRNPQRGTSHCDTAVGARAPTRGHPNRIPHPPRLLFMLVFSFSSVARRRQRITHRIKLFCVRPRAAVFGILWENSLQRASANDVTEDIVVPARPFVRTAFHS